MIRMIVVATVTFLTLHALGADTIDLRPKFEGAKDHVVSMSYRIVTETDADPFKNNQPSTRQQNRRFEARRSVETTGADSLVSYTFSRGKLTTEGMRGPVTYDSAGEEEPDPRNPLVAVIDPLIGSTMTVEIREGGEIGTVEGMNQLFDEIESEAAGRFIFETMQADFTNAVAGYEWGASIYALYPYRSVSPGDSWQREVPLRHLFLGDLVYHYDCRLDRLDERDGRQVAIVTFAATCKQAADSKPGYRVFNMKMDFQSGKVEGTATYDVELGEFVEIESKQEVITRVQSPAPEPGKSLTFTQTTYTTRTMTLQPAMQDE